MLGRPLLNWKELCEDLSLEAQSFLKWLIEADSPRTIRNVLNHPWFSFGVFPWAIPLQALDQPTNFDHITVSQSETFRFCTLQRLGLGSLLEPYWRSNSNQPQYISASVEPNELMDVV